MAGLLFQRQQMRLRVETAGKTRELAGRADHPVAWRHDGNRVSSVCGADGPHGGGSPDRLRDLAIGARLPERDLEQRLPDLALEFRSREIELQRKRLPPAGEILVELPLGLDKDRVPLLFPGEVQTDTPRPVVLPKNRRPPIV